MPRTSIAVELARRLFLSANVLLRIAVIGFAVLLISQFIGAAARAAGTGDVRAATQSGKVALRALRVWPSQDYTRVTLESTQPLKHTLLLIKNPERLVVDIEEVDFGDLQREIAGKIAPDDPYVANLRAGRFTPGVTRLVFDLKTEVKPQIFTLKPVGAYGHRLVLDLYPTEQADPLMALLQKPELAPREQGPRPGEEQAPPAGSKIPDEPVDTKKSDGPAKTLPADRGRPLVGRLVTVAVDAGHGGEDPGARGRRGSFEKNVTLTIARKLKAIIDSEPNMRAMLTRDGDYFIALDGRVKKAQRVKADLFVSIHADAFTQSRARGSSVFALSERGATSKTASLLAQRENEADLIGGVNLDLKDRYLAMTLADLSFTAQINDSLKLGRAVLGELGGVNNLHKEGVEQAGFAVLKAPEIPSILVETAFISNPDEELRLNDDGYQEKIAEAVFRGIKRYFARNPPLSRSTVAAVQ